MSYVDRVVKLANKFIKAASENPFDIIQRKKHHLLAAPLSSNDIEMLEVLKEYPSAGTSRDADDETYRNLVARGLVERIIVVHPTMGHNIYEYTITDAGIDAIERYWLERSEKFLFEDNNKSEDEESDSATKLLEKKLLAAALKANKGHGVQIYNDGQHFGWYRWDAKKNKHEQFSIGNFDPKDTIGDLNDEVKKLTRVNLDDFLPVIAGRKQV